MPNTDPRRSPWRRLTYLLPGIAPSVIMATFVIFYIRFLWCSPDNPCNPLSVAEILAGMSTVVQARVATYAARASWTVANGLHLLSSLFAIITAGFVIYHALVEYETKIRWRIIFIVVVFAADVSLLIALWASNDLSSPGQQLLQNTVGQVLPQINKYNRYADALSFTGTVSLAAAACATLWHRNPDNELDETQVVRRVNLLRPVLYVGAITLAIAVLRLSATFAWAASYLPPDSDIGKSVANHAAGIVASLGTLYTLLMAGVYLPAALLLRARVKAVAATKPDPQGWLSSRGLTLAFPQYLPRAVALLAPVLAGPLGDLLVRATATFGG